MGIGTAVDRAFTVYDSDRRLVSLEFSMAAVLPSRPGNLRGGSAPAQTGVRDSRHSGAWTRRFGGRCRADLSQEWFVRFSAHLDFSRIDCGLGLFGIPVT